MRFPGIIRKSARRLIACTSFVLLVGCLFGFVRIEKNRRYENSVNLFITYKSPIPVSVIYFCDRSGLGLLAWAMERVGSPVLISRSFGDRDIPESVVKRLVEWSDGWEYINFSCSTLDDDGLRWLGACKKLQRLNLWDTHVSDAGMAHLRPLTKLYSLELGNNSITDVGVRDVAVIKSLKHLGLKETLITHVTVAHLAMESEVDRLIVSFCHQLEPNVWAFSQFHGLKQIEVDDRIGTAEIVAILKARNPDIDINIVGTPNSDEGDRVNGF